MDYNYQNNQNQDTGYVNVGSSGTNSANTAENNFAAGSDYTAENARRSDTAYGAGERNAAYDYSSHYGQNSYRAPEREPRPRRSFDGGKWAKRVIALVLVGAIGFGGGYCGALVAGKNQPKVVTQTVERVVQPGGGTTVIEGDLTGVVSTITPSVVVITTEAMVTSNSWFGGQYVQSGAGSGVVFSRDGYILTCNHVVSGAQSIKVTTSDGDEYNAVMVGGDSQSDIAVLKVEADGLTPAVIGDSDALVVGEAALAVGNPLGTLGGTVTNGIVSALNRNITVENTPMTLIQTNAAISPGNSGGGLFNASGELIGITNAKSERSGAEGLSFAIPSNTALQVAEDLIGSGYVTGRPAMGITVITVSSMEDAMRYGVSSMGVYVASVNEGSGAAAAGMQTGDRIVSIDDIMAETTNDVTQYIQSKNVGDTVTVQVARNGKLITMDIVLGESGAPAAPVEG